MARDKKRSRSRSRSRERDRDSRAKDKEKSRQKDGKRERDESAKRGDRDRDRDRERARDRDKKRARSRSRSRSRSPDRKKRERRDYRERDRKDRDRDRDREKPRSGDRDRDGRRGSSPRRGDRHRDRDRDRERDRDRGGDRDKNTSKGSSDKAAAKEKGGKPANGSTGGGGMDLLSKLAAINARVVGTPAVTATPAFVATSGAPPAGPPLAPPAPAAAPAAAATATALSGALLSVPATVPGFTVPQSTTSFTAQQTTVSVPTVPFAAAQTNGLTMASGAAGSVTGDGGDGGDGGGGAKLEASLLASLQKKIKERAAAPEKLKTTGVAFQAVEEEPASPPADGGAMHSVKLALGKQPLLGMGKAKGRGKGSFAFGRKGKGKAASAKKPSGWADDEGDSDDDAEDDKTFFGMGNDNSDDDKKGREVLPPPWEDQNGPSEGGEGGGAVGGVGAAGEAEAMDVSGNGAEGKGDDDDYDPLDAFMTDLKAPAVAQDNMSAAFGAGDMTPSTGSNEGPSAAKMKEILNSTISLEEIMMATKTNETWESDVMESESDFGEDDNDDDATTFEGAEAAAANDDVNGGEGNINVNGASTAVGDGPVAFPVRPRKVVKRRHGRKYYPPPEYAPVDADESEGATPVAPANSEPAFKETEKQRRQREEEEDREERERKEFMENFRKAREEEESKRTLRIAKRQEEEAEVEEELRKKEEKLGRVFAGEGDVMEEHERDQVEQNALQVLQDSMKKKELKPVDHAKIPYISVRKNLYIIPKALGSASDDQKESDRQQLEIKVRGKGCPPVVHTWEQCGFSERVLAVIRRNHFTAPFAIQKQAMPALMSGRDVIGVASTGSGKTLAFILPMLRHIFDQPILAEGKGPIGLIMAPARELAVQIYNEARKFTKALGLRVTAVYGGAGVADQIADLKRGAEIVVCTPGRMIDILTMQAGKLVSLDRVSFVVLDEADRMFDMGFEPQIKMILQNVRPDRQTALFSATFPRTVENLAKKVLHMPLEIIVGGRSVASSDITQHVEIRDDDDKFMRLLQLLGVWFEKGNILVFVDTQAKCDTLFQDLSRAGYNGLSLHGGKDQADRDSTISDFKNKAATLMVATSVAGRGLDVPDLVCVINYSCPNHLEDYVHRVGRTGRAGRKGTAYTFISAEEEQHAPTLIKALTQSKQKIPPELVKMAEEFQAKVDSGQARKASSGFSGKGFTFDDSEQSESQQMRSLEKRQYEIEQGLRDPSELLGSKDSKGADEDGEGEESETSKAAKAEVITKAAMAAASKLLKSSDAVEKMKGTAMMTAAKLGFAVPRAEPGEEGSASKKANTPQEALKEATVIAMKYHHPDGKGADGDPTHFTDKIEINDYPQQARWKITQKSTVNEIVEHTGVAIITKGMYIGNNQKPKEGEERLHLVIEGTSELDVQAGKKEIQRILNEETMKVASSSSFSSGKYSVI